MNPQLRLQKWREGLLDLTRRNRLIHFNPDVSPKVRAPHGVQLAKPDLDTVWDRVALHERLQGFYELESEADTLESDGSEAPERAPIDQRPLAANELRAFPDGPKLSRTLSNLRTRSQTSLAEQGLNTLFVAFGFLRWRDKDDKELLSPLFLVPVELLRKSPRDPFKMRGLGEEAILNPALQLKLKNDFGLELPATLPALEGVQGQSVEAQLRQIETLVLARFPVWRVESLAFLGLFSFHKIAMFNDLGDNIVPLANHSLVRAVCGEVGAIGKHNIIAADQLDGLSSAEAQLVVEADSSQHRAIVAARRGCSFVLQGPPGTGKSQTITNIIAECLENGKTVLFVSEKMAALDVVLGRLHDIGLGDSCLELHSSKANKKEVIRELGRTLLLAAPTPPQTPDESGELSQLRARLSAHVRQIHQPIDPAGLSLYQAIGRATSFKDAPELPFRLDEAPFRSAAELVEIESWLGELEELHDIAMRASDHPWRGLQLSNGGLETRGRLLLACDNAVQNATRLENNWPKLAQIWGFDNRISDLKTLDGALQTLKIAEQLHNRAFALHALERIGEGAIMQRAFGASLRSLSSNSEPLAAQLNAQLASWRAHFDDALLERDPRVLSYALREANWWLSRAGSGKVLQRDTLVLRRALAPSDGSLGALTSAVREQATSLAQGLEISEPTNFEACERLLKIVNQLAELPAISVDWWTSEQRERIEEELREAEHMFTHRRDLRATIAANWDLANALAFDEVEVSPVERAHFTNGDAQHLSAASETDNLAAVLAQLRACGASLAAQLQLENPHSFGAAVALCGLGESIEDCPQLESAWLDENNWRQARRMLSEARSNYEQRPQLQQSLDAHWRADAWDDLARDAEVLAPELSQFMELQNAREAWAKLATQGASPNENWEQTHQSARACSARWCAQLGEANEWTTSQMSERAHWLELAARCHPQSVMWLRFKGNLANGTRALRAEIEGIARATSELATRWKKGASVAGFDAAWSAQFVRLDALSVPQIRTAWSDIVEISALAASGDLDALGHSWMQVAQGAAQLAQACGLPAPDNARASRELLNIADAIGESVAFSSAWLMPVKLAEIERIWNNVTQAEQALNRARVEMGDLQMVTPEVLPDEIIARWPNYRSWMKRLGGDYRADKARVMALYGGAKLPAHPQSGRDLDKLRELRRAQADLERARRELELAAPASPDIAAQIAAAHAIVELKQSWTPQQCTIIEGRERTELRVLRGQLRAAFEILARTVAANLDENAMQRAVLVPHPDAPFAAVASWLRARAALLRPDEFSPALVARDFETANQLEPRRHQNAANREKARLMFGPLWSESQPDWAQLDEAVAQFERVRALRVWPETLAAQLFGTPAAREGARELAGHVSDIARHVTAKLDGRTPAQFIGPSANWRGLETALRSLDAYKIAGWDAAAAARGAAQFAQSRAVETAIARDETAYRHNLGARYRGELSDWQTLETALESARPWIVATPTLNARITELLFGSPVEKAALTSQTRDLDAALERWTRALQSTAGSGQAPNENANYETIAFWIEARALHLRPHEWNFAAWDEMQRDRTRHRQLSAQIETLNAGWERIVGPLWNGENTDFAACYRALQGTQTLCDLCGEVPGIVRTIAQTQHGAAHNATFIVWKSASENLAQTCTLWRAQIAELEACGWFVPAFFESQAPQQREFEAILEGVEFHAPTLRAALAAIETITNSAKAHWIWSDETANVALTEAIQIRALLAQWNAQEARLAHDLGALYSGLTTDWGALNSAIAELEKLIGAAGENGLSTAFRMAFKAGEFASAERNKIVELRTQLEMALLQIAAAFPRDEGWKSRSRLSLGQIRSRLSRKISARDELETWLRFVALVERGQNMGLASALESGGNARFLDLLMQQSLPPAQIKRAFWRHFWSLWLHDLAPHHAAMRSWNGANHAAQTQRFVQADERSQKRAALMLQCQLAAQRPDVDDDYSEEIRLLQHEAGKSRRHIALRQLFSRAADTIQQLKPCFLMSPLSVAHFLEWGVLDFDVVVFDEASQICPEDAIGAIGRAAQMIVVGDKQQLPPTRIFAQSALEDEFDDAEELEDSGVTETTSAPENQTQNGDIESILAFCETAGLPQLSLLWHYRSRHEELIAFSNRHFYDARLQTFPSPARAGSGALEWIKVQGFYQPNGAGAGRAGGTNRIEARHIAQMVATHARQTPHFSLGIITFNEPQRRAVEEEVTRLSLRDAELERFLDEDTDEPFFVKALENVQGDERDAIFFSVGFGPRKGLDGQTLPMRMSFGPLNKEGGERRLNVAVTRAKHQVKIVTSFDPGEIKSEKLKYKGGKLLRSYLEWASAHKAGATSSDANRADDLAHSVARALEARGWQCTLGVGLGDYRVDVGVADARTPDTLKLGIVLDGSFYTGAATVRDRDRLRPLVLRRLGWNLWPIYSLDCAREFERQIEKIDAHLRTQL